MYYGMIEIKRTGKTSLITICNYDKYQSDTIELVDSGLYNQDTLFNEENEEKNQVETIENDKKNEDKSYEELGDKSGEIVQKRSQKRSHDIINKININNSTTISQEKKFFEELEKSQMFTEATKKNLKMTDSELHERHSEFFREIIAKEKTHANYNDYKRHFYDWLNIKKQYEARNNKSRKYDTYKGGNATDDRYKTRRGTDVSAKKAEDFEGAF